MAALMYSSMALVRPPRQITITEHAEDNRILSPENCAIPGPYRVAVTPFIKEILNTIARPDVEKVVCQKSAQVAWTDGVINNAVGYFIDQAMPETAALECKHCQKLFSNAQKNAMLSRGKWRPTAEFTGTAGFYINELYSPFPKATLQNVVEKFLEARKEQKAGNPNLMTTWVNTSLGETWEEKGEGINEEEIKTEEIKPGIAPEGVLIITAGVDVQKDRLELEVVGFGHEEETWSLSYDILFGDPERLDVWEQLDEHLDRVFVRQEHHQMRISCCCVDSGNWTQAVYRYVRLRQKRGIYAVKGKEGHGEAFVSPPTKKSLDKGIKLFMISDQTAVGHIFGKLRVQEPGPGYCHFPDDRPEEYFKQLTGVQLMTHFKNGVPFKKYIPTRPRLEALDCRKYAIAALLIRTKGKPNWKGIAQYAAKALARAKAKAEGKTQEKKKKTARPRPGFVNRWRP